MCKILKFWTLKCYYFTYQLFQSDQWLFEVHHKEGDGHVYGVETAAMEGTPVFTLTPACSAARVVRLQVVVVQFVFHFSGAFIGKIRNGFKFSSICNKFRNFSSLYCCVQQNYSTAFVWFTYYYFFISSQQLQWFYALMSEYCIEKSMDIKIIKLFKREWMDLIQKFSEIVAKTL